MPTTRQVLEWRGLLGITDFVAGVSAGTHTVTFTNGFGTATADANGCTATANGDISEPTPAVAQILISDISGRTIINRTIAANTNAPAAFGIGNLPTGLYIVKLVVDGEIYRTKFNKN